jgi:hypothetical protein
LKARKGVDRIAEFISWHTVEELRDFLPSQKINVQFLAAFGKLISIARPFYS